MVVKAHIDNLESIAKLANLLWPKDSVDDLIKEFTDLMEKGTQLFINVVDGNIVGFAQCQLRHDYVEGTDSSPVGYLEGIFVLEEYRNRGYAKELLSSCEEWARACGCTEFAIDCELGNTDSIDFHNAMGFSEVNRIICFTKKV